MDWLASNWFWLVVLVLFFALHSFGHKHGGHGADRGNPESGEPGSMGRGHRH